tara:strand:+ start:1008 stop:1211 length:204 start_codon:yes stop_codon:yes gene_type:complete
MSYDKVIELIKQFPKNKDVPRLIKLELNKAKGMERVDIKIATEALFIAANDEKDFKLIEKHLSPDAT